MGVKSYLFGFILVLLVFVSACYEQSKIVKIEDDIKTFDDLKKAKEAGKPVSELDKCMKEAEKYEEYLSACVNEKLSKQGYTDGIDCIENYWKPLCNNTDRYNVQVNAYNECMNNMSADRITVMDCTALMK